MAAGASSKASTDAAGAQAVPSPKAPQTSSGNQFHVPRYTNPGSGPVILPTKGTSAIPLTNTAWSLIGPAPLDGGQVPANGPVSGRVSALAADPTNANIIYLGAAGGGVWKSVDAGVTWAPITDNQATLFTGAIAVAPSAPNTIYVGTGEANNSIDSYYGLGVLKSTDGGATWTLENAGGDFTRKTISAIAIDPTNANNVYVAISDGGVNGVGGNTGIWKSTDGGATFTNTTTAIPNVTGNSEFSDVVINPTNPLNLYCAIGSPGGSVENGVYETMDGGATWAASGNFPLGAKDARIRLSIAPSNPQIVYASVADPATQGIAFVTKTIDGGTTWNNTAMPPNYLGNQGFYDTTIAVDPTNANVVFFGGQESDPNTGATQVLETTDGGATFSDISVGANGQNGPHTDHHAMTFDANGDLLDGNDGGVWLLTDATPGAIVWQDINGNLSTLQAEGIGLNPTDPNTAFLGTQDNGTSKFSGALAWNLSDPEGGDGGFTRVDPTNPNTIYHSFAGDDALGGFFMRRSDDDGATWIDINNGLNPKGTDNSDFYVPYQIDQSNPSRLILGTDHLYETLNKGGNWNIISSPGVAGFNIKGAFAGAAPPSTPSAYLSRLPIPFTSPTPPATSSLASTTAVVGATEHPRGHGPHQSVGGRSDEQLKRLCRP